MKNTNIKIILSATIFLSVVCFVGTAIAAGASLYVSPASLTKTVGNAFSVSVGVNASGSKVCAVEGTLVFNNLSCQSITVSGDVMVQSSPTCSNPHFLIGIPSCTTSNKTLLTVSVKAGNAGTTSIGFSGVDIIGEGVSVGSASIGGNYTINAVPKPTPTPTPKSTPTPTPIPETTTPEVTTPGTTTPETTTPVEAEQTAGLAEASVTKFLLASLGDILFSPTAILLIILLVLAALYFVGRKFYRKK